MTKMVCMSRFSRGTQSNAPYPLARVTCEKGRHVIAQPLRRAALVLVMPVMLAALAFGMALRAMLLSALFRPALAMRTLLVGILGMMFLVVMLLGGRRLGVMLLAGVLSRRPVPRR